jgi:hypothetical protein
MHHAIKAYGGVEAYFSFTLLALYPRYPLDTVGGWVDPRVSLDIMEKRKMFPLRGIEPRLP